jgi:hypothetical protein
MPFGGVHEALDGVPMTATMNGHAQLPPVNPEQAQLFAGACATMRVGYLIRMVTLGWDTARGKKNLLVPPPADWQHGAQLTENDVAAAILSGSNAYLYRLPPGTHVVDTDTPETTAEMRERLGEPDVVTGSGGAHWLVDAELARRDGIDIRISQLYGPGSFYVRAGVPVSYTGVVPAAPRHLPDDLPRQPAKSGQKRDISAPVNAPASGLGAWSAQADERFISVSSAQARAGELLTAIATGSEGGAEARLAINNASMFLGGLLHTGWITYETAAEWVAGACEHRWGSASAEDLRWIAEGLADGDLPHKRLRLVDDVVLHAERGPVHPFGEEPFSWQGGTTLHIADALLRRVPASLRVMWSTATTGKPACIANGSRGYWSYVADGLKWAALQLLDTMPEGTKPETKDRKEWTEGNWAHHNRTWFAGAINDVVSLAEARVRHPDHPAVVLPDELDTDPGMLWCSGAPWRLTAVPVMDDVSLNTPHLHSARYAPAAVPTPAWDAFIAAMWPDPEVAEWGLQVLSVGLTGHSDAVMPVLFGETGHGKSKLMGRFLDLLGGYAKKVSNTLIQPSLGNPDVAKAELQGLRFAWLDEGLGTGKASVEAIKDITGGGQVYAAAKYRAPIQFAPTHTIVLTMNGDPEIHDDGLARRARLIPCAGDRDAIGRTFDALLLVWEREAPGVLAQLFAFAAAYVKDWRTVSHDRAPDTVRSRIAEIAESQDVIGRWLVERTQRDENGSRSSDLYAAFREYARQFPEYERRQPSVNQWALRLDREGYGVHRRPNNVKWRPLRLGGGGDYAWSTPSPSVGGVTAPVTADVTAPVTTSEGPNAQENRQSVTAVTTQSITTLLEETSRGNREGGENNRGTAVTAVTPVTAPAALHSAPAGPETILCPRCGDAPGVTAAGKLRAHRLADKSKCEGSGDRAPGVLTKSERDRAAKVAVAEGEWIGLPAAMRRGEEPRAVTVAELPGILAECLRRNGGILAVDVENTARPIGHPEYRVQSVQLGDWAEGVDLDPHDPEQAEIIRAALAGAAELDAHNATADLAPLAHLGLGDYRAMFDKMVDTAVRMKLADPASVGNEAGLKDLSPAVLGAAAVSPGADEARKALFTAAGWLTEVKPETPLEKNGWAQVKPGCATMVRYAISDVLDCAAIRHRIPAAEPSVERRERRVQVITAPTAYAGVPLDARQVSEQIAEREPVIEALGARLAAGGLANARSPKQVTEAFTARGVTIPDSTKFTLQKLVALHPDEGVKAMAADVLAYRKAATFMSTFLVPWREQCERGDGVIRPTIYTLGADTGRMSSVRPNAQNLPKKGGARECWVAGPGKKIIRADMSSVEVRVIAALSQDPQLMAMLANGLKLHDQIAEQVFGPGYTETQRGWAKNGVFAHFFGAGLEKLAATIQAPLEVAAAVVEALGVVAPGVAAWADQVKQAVRGGMNQFRTYSGRIIHLDTSQPHKAVNYLVQGTARELLVDTLLAWDDGPYAGGVIVPVHDEVIAWVDEADAEAATEYLVRCMTRELYGVAITCEPDAPSDRWDSYAS